MDKLSLYLPIPILIRAVPPFNVYNKVRAGESLTGDRNINKKNFTSSSKSQNIFMDFDDQINYVHITQCVKAYIAVEI